MKVHTLCVVSAMVAGTIAVKYTAPRGDTPPLDKRDLSVRGKNLFERQTGYDYCGLSTYYCYNSECCGITTYNCMPPGGECCSSLSTYGYGLWCPSGSSCTVIGGYVQCEDTSGGTFSAGSSSAELATSTDSSDGPIATDPPTSTAGSGSGSGSGGSSKSKTTTKKKSKAWIAGAIAGPLIFIALVAGIFFILTFLKNKKKKAAEANNAAIIAAQSNNNNQNFPPAPPMAQQQPPPQQPQQPPMGPMTPVGAPPTSAFNATQHNPDSKTPAYTTTTYQYNYDVPTPVNSPPPQWTPASPAPMNVSPVPGHAQPVAPQTQTQQGGYVAPTSFSSELHAQSITPVSTGNGVGAGAGTGTGLFGGPSPPAQAQQQQGAYAPRGDAMELPSTVAAVPPRNGAHEMG